jgi:hypothetical protein
VIEPRGEYVFGVVGDRPMRARRGRQRRLVAPGGLVAWDPTGTHAGAAVDGRPWTARLIVVEVADLHALADDPDGDILADVAFPEPCCPMPSSPAASSSATARWKTPPHASNAT